MSFVCGVALWGILAGAAHGQNLRLWHAVIIRAEQPSNDLNLKAYSQVLDAVALPWRMAPVSDLQSSVNPDGLVLVIPLRSAQGLAGPQIEQVLRLVDAGAVLVSEGITPLTERCGFRAGALTEVTQLEELAYPEMMIVWQRPGGVFTIEPAADTAVLTREKWSGAPLVALRSRGRGHCLLLATELDPVLGEGYARFPYFPQALLRAGVVFPFRAERLSAFFDYAYRMQADLEYFARKWRRAGIQALHVSAWYFWERDAARDDYLARLIAACRRNGILVYAWLELPHVSQAFWEQNPQWREKTAIGQDAHLDWRYLMNLKDAECFRAVAGGLRRLIQRFDWDGVNVGELYFESPQGPKNPQRMTPFNEAVRSEFKARHRIDPLDFFREDSAHYWKKDGSGWARFVDYRVEQVRLLNERFLKLLSEIRSSGKPDLRLAVTFVDNLYDTKMREAVGADIKQMLPLLGRHDFTLVMEDPGTVWHLGPRRYSDLAESYARLHARTDRLGIDINIVERWQDVYPTKKQTGAEFLELFHHAGKNFPTVLVYFEHSILNQDLETVAHALAAGASAEASGRGIAVQAPASILFETGAGQESSVDFRVDGRPWPCVAGDRVLLPAGRHEVSIAPAAGRHRPRLVKLNGELRDARYDGDTIEFSYSAGGRAIALFDRPFKTLQIDAVPRSNPPADFVLLPGGSHRVRISF